MKEPWPTEADLRRELLIAAIMWGCVTVAVVFLGVLLFLLHERVR